MRIVVKCPVVGKHALSFQPVNFDFLLQRFEFGIPGNEFGFFIFREGSSEGIGEAEADTRFVVRGQIS